ncbi:MAG: EamA family transporter [Treponema sp.]|nr:EamA family transporter [Treponema sp.]MDY4131069.1 EamA family transporter [Treponema sp.]
MYISFFIYSFSGIFSKIASTQEFLSLKYIFCFGAIIMILGIYAVLWQQILKKIELSVAMSNKPLVLILGTVWAVLFFNEEISTKFVVGMILIFVGILIVSLEKK